MNPFQTRKSFLNRLSTKKPSNIINASAIKKKTCKVCRTELDRTTLKKYLYTCPHCGYYFPMSAKRRLQSLFDNKLYRELFTSLTTVNVLSFPDYDEKIQALQQKTTLMESVVCAVGEINHIKTAVAVMDTRYLMGSLGTATGEKIALLFEYATLHQLPVVIFTASGGARMQEGIYSLFQMAKTSATVRAHGDEGLLYITVMTHPTTGGVTASFASLGDIILAEPKALVGFAGPRVIEQTIRQKLPPEFQTAEYVLETGFIDAIVKRDQLKRTLGQLLAMHQNKRPAERSDLHD